GVLATRSKGGVAGPSMGPPAGAAVAPGVPGAAPPPAAGAPTAGAGVVLGAPLAGASAAGPGPVEGSPARVSIDAEASDTPKIAASAKPAGSERLLIEFTPLIPSSGRAQLLGIALRVASAMSRPS